MNGSAALKIWKRAFETATREFKTGNPDRISASLEMLGTIKPMLIDAIDTDECGAIGNMMAEHRTIQSDFARLREAMAH